MKSLCLIFQIHQPFRLKRYRFFDIGNDHYYYDDFANDEIVSRIGNNSYLPTIRTLNEMHKQYGDRFRVAISITGTAVEQLQQYVPEVIEELKTLADTGCVEFLSGTYSHSLASVEDADEFRRQVDAHDSLIKEVFGHTPTFMENTELIFDDDIALQLVAMGFKGVLTDGAKHVLGWRSPDYVYSSAAAPSLNMLLTNDKLSGDITRNFNNPAWDQYPLTADKFMGWIASMPQDEQVVNLLLSMETFGEFLPANTGIFDFLKALPRFANEMGIELITPTQAIERYKPVAELAVPYPLSWADEARDISAWKGNELQNRALEKLYSVSERVNLASDRRLKQDWKYLQSSDHFYYMSTKQLADGASHALFSPYDSPYAAFINYMNVLADFLVRVQEQFPSSIENEELNSLLLTIRNQAKEIDALNKEITSMRTNMLEAEANDEEEAEAAPKKETDPKKKATKAKTTATTRSALAKKAPTKKSASTTKKAATTPRKKSGE